jgi:hypothetical protein
MAWNTDRMYKCQYIRSDGIETFKQWSSEAIESLKNSAELSDSNFMQRISFQIPLWTLADWLVTALLSFLRRIESLIRQWMIRFWTEKHYSVCKWLKSRYETILSIFINPLDFRLRFCHLRGWISVDLSNPVMKQWWSEHITSNVQDNRIFCEKPQKQRNECQSENSGWKNVKEW